MEFIDIWKFKNTILANVSIIDIALEYGLKLENKSTGQFSHRALCPFHKGKNGKVEKTPSMFLSKETNSFCCFGCSAGSSVFDFVRLMDGCPAEIALIKLAKRIGLIDKDGKWDELKASSIACIPDEPIKTIIPYLFEISFALRNYIKLFINTGSFDKEFKWMEKVAKKTDEFLSNIGHEDWEYAEELADKIKQIIKNRIRENK